jgi:hypothetical protein
MSQAALRGAWVGAEQTRCTEIYIYIYIYIYILYNIVCIYIHVFNEHLCG